MRASVVLLHAASKPIAVLVLLAWASACHAPAIATVGIASDTDATAALAEINQTLLSAGGAATPARDVTPGSYRIACDSGTATASVSSGSVFAFSFSDCSRGSVALGGNVTWSFTPSGGGGTGTLSLDGSLNYASSAFKGSFDFAKLVVTFAGSDPAGVSVAGAFSVGGKSFTPDHSSFAAHFSTFAAVGTLHITGPDVRVGLAAAAKATCAGLDLSAVHAKAIVSGMEQMPCPLAVGPNGVTGDCASPSAGRHTVTLRWYTVAPNTKQERTLAESIGALDTSELVSGGSAVSFDPSLQPSLLPKTVALATESTATRDAFNCDRTGTNVCDSTSPAPTSLTDVDTCSNLMELCMGTLYQASVDQCP